jgi:hypothetical protein
MKYVYHLQRCSATYFGSWEPSSGKIQLTYSKLLNCMLHNQCIRVRLLHVTEHRLKVIYMFHLCCVLTDLIRNIQYKHNRIRPLKLTSTLHIHVFI